MIPVIQSALLIFGLRVAEMALGTLRMLLVVRGRKGWAWVTGFLASLIYVLAIGLIVQNLDNLLTIAGYATGFATGNVLGMWIEEKLALGYVHLRIISPHLGAALAGRLRGEGYAVTEFSGRGRDGAVDVLICSVLRRQREPIERLARGIDPEAFITAEDVRLVSRGYWGR